MPPKEPPAPERDDPGASAEGPGRAPVSTDAKTLWMPSRTCPRCRAVYSGDERFCPMDGAALADHRDGGGGDPLIGRTIDGRYLIRRRIGQGGMGVVYAADHVGLDKRVAVKFLRDRYTEDGELMARFRREARTAGRIGHEHIIDVTDLGETEEGRSYIVMEYLEGRDLAAVLRANGPLPAARAVDVVGQILRGLEAAHAKGVIHRDMKPENVFLTRRGGKADFVKIMDFGISKIIAAHDARVRLTQTGAVVGTPVYMAPEQAQGEPTMDHRVDLYAVGVMLFELLAGRPPFVGPSYLSLVTKHLTDPPPTLRSIRPDIPEVFEPVVQRALAKNPADRFASAVEFLAALPAPAAIAHAWESSASRPETGPAPAGSQAHGVFAAPIGARRKGRRALALVAVVAGTAGAVAIALAVRASRSGVAPPPDSAAAPDIAAAPGPEHPPATASKRPPATAAPPATASKRPPATAAPAPAAAPAPPAPSAKTGILDVDSAPRPAHVYVNNRRLGDTPLSLALPPGRYALRIRRKGFAPVDTLRDVKRGETVSFFAALAPAAPPRRPGRHPQRKRAAQGAGSQRPAGRHPAAAAPPERRTKPAANADGRKANPYLH